MMNSKISFTIGTLILFSTVASPQKRAPVVEPGAVKNPQIKFTENKGQWQDNILFRAQLDGGVLFLEKNCFTYNFYEKEKVQRNHVRPPDNIPSKEELEIREHAFRVTMKNALPDVRVTSSQRSSNYSNFFIGNNPKRWASKAYDYSMIYYNNIYDRIDLEVNGRDNSMKYNFIVEPGADPRMICMQYYGVSDIKIENGSLRITTPLTTIIEKPPYAYQEINGQKITVPCHFVLNDREVSFSLPEGYDGYWPLIIDPTLIFCSYSGSIADNFGMTATYDNMGNFYAGGTAFAQGYPITSTAFDTTYNGIVQSGMTDVVITKYNSTGTNLIYSTYLGGASSTEIVSSIIVNKDNQLMLLGATGSTDFPVTPNAFDLTFNGGDSIYLIYNGTLYRSGTDIYLSKLSLNGDSLLASTYVGGTENDGLNSSSTLAFNYGDYYRGEIQSDSAANFYAVSCTYSSDFPATSGSFQNVHAGGLDGCVFKMSPDLTSLSWCTFLGGLADDCANAQIQDDSLNIFVTGGTSSNNFPTTTGTISPSYQGGIVDGFIIKIKPDGTSILHSTFLGTNLYDQCFFVQRDTLGSVYVFGQSQGNFPVSPGVYANPGSKQFVARLSSGLDTLQLSTVFGNGSSQVNLCPSAFLVDRCGNIYCSGWGGRIINPVNTMQNMPVTSNAIQSTTDGHNFYFIVFSPFFQSLTYASYFGGNVSWEHVDGGTSRFDRNGVIYQSACAGCQTQADPFPHSDLPTTPGAWSSTNNSNNCNNGTIKIDFNITNTLAAFTSFPTSACPYVDVAFTNNSVSAIYYEWDFGDSSPVSNTFNTTHSYSAGGTYIVRLISSSPFCGIDTAYDTINVYIPPIAAFTDTGTFCEDGLIQFTNNSTIPATYLWNFGDGDTTSVFSPSHFYSPGSYTVNLYVTDSLGCKDTATQNIVIHPQPVASINYSLDTCALNVDFSGSPANAVSYQWDFGDATFGTGQTVSHSYQQSGNYTVTLLLTDIYGCTDTDTVVVPAFAFSIADFSYVVDSCLLNVAFTNESFNLFLSQWDFGDLSTLSDTSTLFNTDYTYPDTGYFNVTLLINAGTPCADTITKTIQLTEPFAQAKFIYTIDTCSLDAQFINQSINALTSRWIFDNVHSVSSFNAIHNYPRPGTYTVTLIVNESNRCNDDTTIQLILDERYFAEYFVPNIFTPNNDGFNQQFVIGGTDFCGDFHIQIYNRWGQLMFESDNIAESWDGRNHTSGGDVPDGVYFYIIDGSRLHKTGTVTVKRR